MVHSKRGGDAYSKGGAYLKEGAILNCYIAGVFPATARPFIG